MPITYASGDPLLTHAQTLAFGYNAQGRSEMDPLATALFTRYPAAFATFGKQARHGRIQPGQLWPWTESTPRLLFMVVRETAVGITRGRYVESCAMLLARDYRLYGLTSVAIAPIGTREEWPLLRQLMLNWLSSSSLPVTLYTDYQVGVLEETMQE